MAKRQNEDDSSSSPQDEDTVRGRDTADDNADEFEDADEGEDIDDATEEEGEGSY
jgi:hypothetical protein